MPSVENKMKNGPEARGTTGATWNKVKNKKFMERYCAFNAIAQQNTKLAIAIVTKGSISDVDTWSHL